MKKLLSFLFFSLFAVSVLCAEISLTVKSSQDQATVTVNGKIMGKAPLILTDVPVGLYSIRVEKPGYYPWRAEIALNDGDHVLLYAELEQITGAIIIDCVPVQPVVFVDGELFQEHGKRILYLSEGFHTITLKSFGYQDFSEHLYVLRNSVQRITARLQPASFDVTGLSSGLRRFNPANPGGLGTVTIPFTVTAPGTAEILLLNAAGEQVATYAAGPFTTWNNAFSWNGAGSQGDGMYTIRFLFQGQSPADQQPVVLAKDVPVQIDSTLTYHLYLPGDVGLSAGAVPLALLSPAKTVIVAFSSIIQDHTIPLTMGIEYTPTSKLSLTISDTLHLNTAVTAESGIKANTLNMAAKYVWNFNRYSQGAALRYQWTSSPLETGLYDRTAGLAAEYLGALVFKNWYAGFSEGLVLGNDQGLFKDSSLQIKTGIAATVHFGPISLDAYGTLYSKTGAQWIWNNGWEAGGTIHILAGSSHMLLTGGGKAYKRPSGTVRPAVILGVTVLN